MKKAAAKSPTTTSNGVESLGKLGIALIDIGWQLAITVIGLLWLGNWADKRYDTKPVFILSALVLIVISFVLIVRRVLQKLPREYGGLR